MELELKKDFLEYKTIKWFGEIAQLVSYQNREFLILEKEDFDPTLAQSFKRLKFENAINKAGEKFIFIDGDLPALLAIGENINEIGLTLGETLLKLNQLFEIKKDSHLKFRGDLAEVIFLYYQGGEKINNQVSADIILNGKMIEVKSIALQKETITISKQQLSDDTEKYGVYLKFSNNGLTIIEIAKKIKNNNKFVNYLLKKYQNTVFAQWKYDLSKPINITNQIPSIQFPSSVIDAKLIIKINS